MNILFVNYGDFTTNSLNHIGGFARALSAGGHACVVAVPSGMDTLSAVPNPGFTAALYNELLERPAFFPDRRAADVIHAWTPREFVRKFVVSYQRTAERAPGCRAHRGQRGVPHLRICEEADHGAPVDGFRRARPIMSDRLPHPLRHRTFLRLADLVTVIVHRLREFVPAGVPFSVLEPGVDPQYLRPAAADRRFAGNSASRPARRS